MKEHTIAKYAESTIYDRELLTRLVRFNTRNINCNIIQ